MTLENQMLKFEYDMKVMEKKTNKLKDRDDLDFSELTVSEDEFDDEESKKFSEYIKARREEIKTKAD